MLFHVRLSAGKVITWILKNKTAYQFKIKCAIYLQETATFGLLWLHLSVDRSLVTVNNNFRLFNKPVDRSQPGTYYSYAVRKKEIVSLFDIKR